MKIAIVEHDPLWLQSFERIKASLLEILKDIPYVQIEHVGSTAIPGLAAKPIIDVDIIVESKCFPAACSALSTNGYTYNPEPRGIDRMSFRYNAHSHDSGATRPTEDGDVRRAVYVNMPFGTALKNHLIVKKVLLDNPKLIEEYSEIKMRLAKTEFDSIGSYVSAKNSILSKILQLGDLDQDEAAEISSFNVLPASEK